MQQMSQGRHDGRRRVSYLELRRAAKKRQNAKRALRQYHQLLSKNVQPRAFHRPDTGYFVVEPARN